MAGSIPFKHEHSVQRRNEQAASHRNTQYCKSNSVNLHRNKSWLPISGPLSDEICQL